MNETNNNRTKRQRLGIVGEQFVIDEILCPKCLTPGSHVPLPKNTACVDLECLICGVQSQVKTITSTEKLSLPQTVLGGSWRPKKKLLDNMVLNPYFFVFCVGGEVARVLYLPAENQKIEHFEPRKPLSEKAKSPGWTGYKINLKSLEHLLVEIY